jgi:hypothetical protein
LTDGSVICQGGVYWSHAPLPDWYKLTPDVHGSYINGTWSKIASLPAGYVPYAYGSAVLADGRVVIIGGEYDVSGNFVVSNKGAIYDPAGDTWTPLEPPPGWLYIGDAPSVVLPDGKYMIGSKLDTRLAVLDPASLTWTLINPTGKSNGFNSEEGWILLPDGSILTLDVRNAPYTERYIPSLATWVPAGNTPVDLHTPGSGDYYVAPGITYPSPGEIGVAMRRPDGTVFAVGANGHTAIFTPPPANSTAPGVWVSGPDLPNGLHAEDAPAAMLPNGHMLIVGNAGGPPLAFFEVAGANLIPVPASHNASMDVTTWTDMLVLPTGQVMLVDSSSFVDIYTPAGAHDSSWAPTIASVPSVLESRYTYTVSGTQFNGLSQGSFYGDERENATNYPLVRITNNITGHVFYAKTHGHSSMGVATGSTPVSTSFDVPANVELGAAQLSVVVNGIPSLPVPVTITSPSSTPITVACPTATSAVGLAYNSAVSPSGGQPPYTYSLVGGSLPPGLLFNSATGVLTGTPTAIGTFTFAAMATDSHTPIVGSGTGVCTITTLGYGGSGGALVQSVSTTSNGPGNSSQSVYLPATVTRGNTIFVFAQYYGPAVTATVSDNCSDQFQEIPGSPVTAGVGTAHWFYAKNVTGGVCLVRVTYSSPTNYGGLAVFEVSGLGGANMALDQHAGASGTGGTASVSITPTRANSFAIAQVWSNNGGGRSLGGSWITQERVQFSTLYQGNMAGWQIAAFDPVALSTNIAGGSWVAMVANFYDSGGTAPPGTVPITIAASPSAANLAFAVDGTNYRSSQLFNWRPGDQHTIDVTVPGQDAGPGARWAFTNWSDGGARSHTITVPAAAATYTASFTRQYYLTTTAIGWGTTGTMTPAPPGVWLDAGPQSPPLQVSAMAGTGYEFAGFSGVLSGVTNPQFLADISGPLSITANFAAAPPMFYPPSGPYSMPILINHVLSAATVRYTINDNSPPSRTYGTVYTTPIALTATSTIQAIAYIGDYPASSVVSATYTVNSGAGGPSALVQSNSAASNNPGNTSQSVAFRSNVAPGNTIFVFAQYYRSVVAATVSDNCADSFQEITGSPGVNPSGTAHWFYAKNVTGGPCTVTVRYSSPTPYGGVAIFEVSGLGGANLALDQQATGAGTGSTVSATINPTRPNSFAIAQVWSNGGGAVALGGNWTTQERVQFSTLYQSNLAGWQVLSSNAPVGLSTRVGTGSWIAMVANFYDSGGAGPPSTVPITVAGISFTVDGTLYSSSQQFNWTPGEHHTIAVPTSPLPGATGTRYVFANWSDAGAPSHSITVPSAATTYTANFTTQYSLTTSASAGGSIAPAPPGLWLNAGVHSPQVQVTAAPNSGFQFTGFSGALSGTTNPQFLSTISGPLSVNASFSPVSSGGSTPAMVQSNSTASNSPGSSSQSVAFRSAVAPGNTIFVFAQYYRAAVAATVSDNCADGFQEIAGSPVSAGGGTAHWFYARNVNGGPCTVTVSYSSPTPYGGVAVFEISGLGGANLTLDQQASGTGNSTVVAASVTPTRTNSFAIAQIWSNGGGAVSLGGSWTTQERAQFSTLYQANMAGWQILTSAAPVSLSTHVGGGPWIAMVANFYPGP